jgi:hypothetical protein
MRDREEDHFYRIMAWTLTDKRATIFPRWEVAALLPEITVP